MNVIMVKRRGRETGGWLFAIKSVKTDLNEKNHAACDTKTHNLFNAKTLRRKENHFIVYKTNPISSASLRLE